MTAHDDAEQPTKLSILWTTFGSLPQPLVALAIKGDIGDWPRAELLQSIAEHITEGRKRQGDKVEEYIGRGNVEDHVSIKANSIHWAKPDAKGRIAPPALVRWLVKTLPTLGDWPRDMPIEVAWKEPQTHNVHPQPGKTRR